VLRQGYRRPIPDWNPNYVSTFRYDGMRVRITNASFGFRLKTLALKRAAVRAIEVARRGP
jgi:hypothetical protein